MAGTTLTGRPGVRIASAAATVLAAIAGCAGPALPPPAEPPAVVGEWVQVYPARGASDTLVIRADGTVGGSVKAASLSPASYDLHKWQIGTPLMPEGLCLGEGPQPDGRKLWHCRAYRISGDTLALSGEPFPAFVRVRADGRHPDGGSAGAAGSRVPAARAADR